MVRGIQLAIYLLISVMSTSQTTFQNTYGQTLTDHAECLVQTTDGGFAVCGGIDRFASLLRTNQNGDTLWIKKYGGAVSFSVFRSLLQTDDGGFVATGSTADFGHGSDDVFLVRTNSLGDTMWTRAFGDSGSEWAYDLKRTTDGGYILTGLTASTLGADWDLFLIRTDSMGNSMWMKRYGGTGDDYGCAIQVMPDGGFIIGGGTTSFGPGQGIYLIRTDPIGNINWTRKILSTGQVTAIALQRDLYGGFVIVGNTAAGACLIKTDTVGFIEWTGSYNGFIGTGCVQDMDSGYVISGWSAGISTLSNAILVKLNSGGNYVWGNIYTVGSDDNKFEAVIKISGGYAATGQADRTGTQNGEQWLVKTDSLGNSLCASYPSGTNFNPGNFTDSSCVSTVVTWGFASGTSCTINSGCNLDRICSSGMQDDEIIESYLVYPTPASEQLTVKPGNESSYLLVIYDMQGRKVFSQPGHGKMTIEVENYSRGLYLLQLSTGQGVVFKKKLLFN
jgi:hypothetical protein